MSRSMDMMKLKINKACDLSSISVLPPHSRRSNPMSQPSQLRSQSQNSFSQGVSLSQLSQGSHEEHSIADQRFDSQEREKSSTRVSLLAPGVAKREESQLQLSRISNGVVRRWGTASMPDSRCQMSEEFENKIRHMESSLNKMCMILDSVQSDVMQVNRAVKEVSDSVRSDVMQVNRAVKEVSLETEGVQQKITLLDNSMKQLVKEEEALKAFLDTRLKAIPNQILHSDSNKLNEITSKVLLLPKQMETCLVKFQQELFMIMTKKLEIMASGIKANNTYPERTQSPKSKCYIATRQYLKNQMQNPMMPPAGHRRRSPSSKIEAEIPLQLKPKLTAGHRRRSPSSKIEAEIPLQLKPKLTAGHRRRSPSSKIEAEIPLQLKPKLTGSSRNTASKQEEISLASQRKNFRVIIDSDEESDGGLSCLHLKKETGKESCLIEEAKEETIRILRKARKRRRKQDNCVILD